jgi:two-component system alkaline phosphatase synthesis response regulator PhoP
MLTTLLGIILIEAKAVRTAAQALSSIRSEHFDLYLLDSRLSDADGFELCRQIRDHDPQTPILFFSGSAFDTDKKKGIEAGANDYVIKPDLEALLGSIKQFVAQEESHAAAKTLPSRPNINSFSPFTFDPAAA